MSTSERDTDSLIRDLADEVRNGTALSAEDRELEDFCAGQLSALDREAIVNRARGNAERTRALEALAPIDHETREKMTDAIVDRLLAERAPSALAASGQLINFGKRVQTWKSRRARKILYWGLPGLAATASLLLSLQVSVSDLAPSSAPSSEKNALGYTLSVETRAAEQRGARVELGAEGEVVFDPTRPQVFVFRPESASSLAPTVTVFHADETALSSLRYDSESSRGAVRVTLGVSALQALPGSGTLVFVVSESQTAADAARVAALESQGPGWQRFVINYRKLEGAQ